VGPGICSQLYEVYEEAVGSVLDIAKDKSTIDREYDSLLRLA
jgi:hypothetical protein